MIRWFLPFRWGAVPYVPVIPTIARARAYAAPSTGVSVAATESTDARVSVSESTSIRVTVS